MSLHNGPSLDSEPVYPNFAWSDDDFETVARLNSSVDKVKNKATSKIMLRKTFTTREELMKVVIPEISMVCSGHINFTSFYGAYLPPSGEPEISLLTEYCEGGNLEDIGNRLKQRHVILGERIGEKIAGRLAEGILQGLAYLHSKETMHRDIKPSNILLSSKGIVKLCEFGVSSLRNWLKSGECRFDPTDYAFSYMAPEKIVGEKYTIRADVWSTGLTLLELAQQRFPYPADLPPIELMMYITADEPPQLEDEPGLNWSDEMKDFIKQTLTVDSQTRPMPGDLLAHPWVVNCMKQEVDMERWIRQILYYHGQQD
ncbi:kinase-like protein [Favolaschia claudopus]|uniref:mitogen-activated protein kinase kinase n=1 Tax=Favolaschia claudopus TaxID=2862362 RepID=A0AAW0ED61_9AGAR